MADSEHHDQTETAPRATTSLADQIVALQQQLAAVVDRLVVLEEQNSARAHSHWADVETSSSGFPYLPRGKAVYFAAHADGGPYLAWGWWPRESWGVWGQDGRHALRFALDGSYAGGYIELRLTFQVTLGADVFRPTITITANGFIIASHIPKGGTERINMRVPVSAIDDGDILLYFDHDRPVNGDMVTGNGDDRMVGVGMISLEIR